MYALGLKIKVQGNSYLVIQDRLIFDLSELADDEFEFTKIGNFYFVAKYDDINSNNNCIGFWHTIIRNSTTDINNLNLKFLKQGVGAFLSTKVGRIQQGYLVGNQLFGNNIDLDLDDFTQIDPGLKFTEVNIVKSPIQIKAEQRAKYKKQLIGMLILWLFMALVGFGYYQYFVTQNSVKLNEINTIKLKIDQYQQILRSQKTIDLSQSQYIDLHKNNIVKYLTCTNSVVGEVLFTNHFASLKATSNNDTFCLENIGFKFKPLSRDFVWGAK